MKSIYFKVLVIGLVVLSFKSATAQNLQLHYDFGAERDFITSTFEYGKFTEKSNTFMFLDMDYSREDGAGLAYWEISHEFKINSVYDGFAIHVEYNDGLLFGDKATPAFGIPIYRSFLGGLGLPVKIGNFKLNTAIMAKYFAGYTQSSVDAQFTVVWFHMFFDGKITFNGFADFWSQDLYNNGTKYGVFLCEPQLWYNVTPSISLGGEVELSKNFIIPDNGAFMARPTLAVKWNI